MDEYERFERRLKGFAIAFISVLILFGVLMAIPGTRKMINEYVFLIERVDEETDYTNRKMVEDTARAMISNYNSRKLEYETYKNFAQGTPEYQRALDAKTAANNIASTYNNYLTQNNYIFKGNLPYDIPFALPYI